MSDAKYVAWPFYSHPVLFIAVTAGSKPLRAVGLVNVAVLPQCFHAFHDGVIMHQ